MLLNILGSIRMLRHAFTWSIRTACLKLAKYFVSFLLAFILMNTRPLAPPAVWLGQPRQFSWLASLLSG
jgi:uncharacterized membrane protein